MSRIGIFFIKSNGELIAKHIPDNAGRVLNGLYDTNDDHWKLFDEQAAKFNTDEYIDVPRGRVIFDKPNDTSIIYLDTCYVHDERVIDKIINLFQVEKYVIKTDNHYQCPKCLEDIWGY